jgi:hypothetical protein
MSKILSTVLLVGLMVGTQCILTVANAQDFEAVAPDENSNKKLAENENTAS